MSSLAVRARFEPIRTIAAADIGSGLTMIGTILVNAARQFYIFNGTDALLMFSTDGINNQFVLPSNGYMINDLTSNKTQVHGLYLPTGGGLWVAQIGTPTTGSVYFTVMYGAEL